MLPEEADFTPGQGGSLRSEQIGRTYLWIGIILGTAGLAVASLGGSIYYRVGKDLRHLSPIAATYERMCRWADLVRLGTPGQPTPNETADYMGEALPEQSPAIHTIVSRYVRERFSRHRPFPQDVAEVRRAWKKLRWPLWRHWLQRLVPKKAAREPTQEVEE